MSITREDVSFISGGLKCTGWFYRPEGTGPFPCVILAHGLGGVRSHRLDLYAQRFAGEGIAALAFDYRHWADSEGEPRMLVSISRQLADYEAAMDWARSLPEINSQKIALWGSSFSGGHVLALAAKHHEIAAVISQCPFTDGVRDGLSMRGLWQLLRLTAAGVYDQLRGWLGLSPFYVATVGAPGTLAALNKPGALDGYLEVARTTGTENSWKPLITARSLLRIPFYRPITRIDRISCPLLLCICEADTEVRPETALKAIARTVRGEAKSYPITHFQVYLAEGFERVSQDQIIFLRKHLF
jgi:fermentation-respiration switch protein FrsA (DUF1100 family)